MKIGFIGLGLMGTPMARNLLSGGHDLTVYDLRREAADGLTALGARAAGSPREVAGASDLIFTSLPGPAEVEEAATGEGGLLSGARPGTTYLDLSTIDPDTVKRIASVAQRSGVEVLDAPVSGGVTGAEEATLCVMVGGDRAVYDRFKPVLDLIGDKVMYCGELGAGAVCKIVNNLIGMSLRALIPEAFTLGIKAGVDAGVLYEAVSQSSGDSQTLQSYPDTLFARNFEPGFRLDLAAKDVGLALQMAQDLDVPMDLSGLVQQRYAEAIGRGWGRLEASAVARIQEELSGMEIRT